MKVISAAVLSVLFCTAVSASSKGEEHRTAFFDEDVPIKLLPGNVSEVVFTPANGSAGEVVLMRAGRLVPGGSGRLRHVPDHLVIEDVKEENEGTYTVRSSTDATVMKRLVLIVRDCSVEQVVKYGESYHIHLKEVEAPVTVEFRPSLVLANETASHSTTELPSILLYNQSTVLSDEFSGRLSVSDKWVTLHSVRMTDEGSYTVKDRSGKARRRNCLNVREHQTFLHLLYGGNLRMKLYRHHSNLSITYRPKSDNRERVVLDRGVLLEPQDPLLEGRLSVEGSELLLKKLHVADTGVFRVTDLSGFAVAHVYIEVEAYKLPPLAVAVVSMLSLIAFMLLVCLLSCLYKIHRRNEKNKKLLLLAQQAGKGDGDAFRQVVHEAYTRFTEESLTQSVCDKPSERTEVTIKGLEVSKPGRYQALTSDHFLEMSDSGAEFTHSGLPLDSDTEPALTFASHKPLLNAMSPTAVTGAVHIHSPDTTVVPDGELSASRTPDSVVSASPASNPRSLTAATPDGSLHGAASPGGGSRGSAKTEGGAEGGEEGGAEGGEEGGAGGGAGGGAEGGVEGGADGAQST
ncbi:uncharacterized protein LOC114866110 [Betta splendens]|uniref:Uncharacterized protein LOC114866110 n=1 Tax=Betta splendens TaxID=158456 RepID=A0A6P7P040_BETSP|nr:uncharacterized protein LOC114866110 [Betta splendens]XP_029023617.1 uncharacterized protein LOC114866110 [Betta splendens]